MDGYSDWRDSIAKAAENIQLKTQLFPWLRRRGRKTSNFHIAGTAGCRTLRTRPRTLRLRNLCMLGFFSQVNCFQPRTKTPDDRMTLQMLKLQLALITKQLETRALVADLVH